jgi:hypothetical protein
MMPRMARRVRLYHYTSHDHLPYILYEGMLTVTESNISKEREHAGPDVVWLTTDPDVSRGSGLENPKHDKFAVRFTVEVDRRAVHKWRDWARSHGIAADWMETLASLGGSASWRVIERPILAKRWVDIVDMRTGRSLPFDG